MCRSGRPMDVIANPKVPFGYMLKGGLKPGQRIVIEGRVRPFAAGFRVNLEHLQTQIIGHPFFIALSYNVQFARLPHLNSKPGVTLNTYMAEKWGVEQKARTMPFEQNNFFTIEIDVDDRGYEIFVDGQAQAQFYHRWQQLKLINHLNIDGDVSLRFVRILEPLDPSQVSEEQEQENEQ